MKQETRKRIGIISSSLMISLSMMLSILPQGIKATEEDVLPATPYVNQTEEHIHDENCGYVEAKEEVACDHIHDETCGELADEVDYPDCQHIHENCNYQEIIEGQPCKLQNTNHNAEINMGINQLNDVVAEEVEIIFDEDSVGAMQTAITEAMEGIDKSKITTIKVTGNAGTITDKNWKALLTLYAKGSEYKSLKALDLSAMINLTTIASSGGSVINPTQLTTVSLPDTLTEIGKWAFIDCKNLNINQLPSKLETIGHSAFYGCSSLSLTELPDTITSIGDSAFSYCPDLALTKLPSKLKEIEQYTFIGCTNLNIKTLPEDIDSIEVGAFLGSGITEIVIPSKVQKIGVEAFSGCSNLNKITFEGSKAPTLYEGAFNDIAHKGEIIYPYDGTGYDAVINNFPNQTWNIDKVAIITYNGTEDMNKLISALNGKDFTTLRVVGNATAITDKNWKALLSLYTENSGYSSLKALDLSAMSNLTTIASSGGSIINPIQLKTVELPEKLTEIGEFTFSDCENLNISQLPSNLEIIGISAFSGCSSLSLTELPDTITSIGDSAFSYCPNLALTKLPSKLKKIEQYTFIGCTNLNIKTLPEDIEYIGSNAFFDSGITEIVIPSKVAWIGYDAFSGCSKLNKITFEGNVSPSLDTYMNLSPFSDLPENGTIYYPEGASDYEWIATVLPTWKVNPKETVPSGSSSSHSHYYGKQWKSDEENHWHECSCGKQKDVEAHEFDEWVVFDEEHRERECRICGFIQKETFIQRQLTDAVTGVQLSGTMSERAELVVSESPSHAVGLCSACDEIRSLMSEGKLIKAYEISLMGDYKGELTLSFPMDPKYNGESFMLYHYVEDGRDDQLISVNNGKAEGKVKTLSPFAIVRSNETITQQVSLNQGEQITIYPATMDGVWAYDDEMIQLTQNKDSYTITAIKEGSTSAVYTTKTTQTIVDVNIPASHVPNTNDATRIYMMVAIFSLCGLVLIKMNQRKMD